MIFIKSVSISFLFMLMLFLILAMLLSFTALSFDIALVVMVVLHIIFSFISGGLVGYIKGCKGLINGFITGLLFLALTFTTSLIITNNINFDFKMMIIYTFILISSIIGSILATNMKAK